MPDEFIHKHPVAEMLEAGEPEVAEYWLNEPDIDQLIDDMRAGRIDEDTFNRQAEVWKQGWIKKLNAWNEGMNHDITFPKDPRAPRVMFTATPIDRKDPPPSKKQTRSRSGPSQ